MAVGPVGITVRHSSVVFALATAQYRRKRTIHDSCVRPNSAKIDDEFAHGAYLRLHVGRRVELRKNVERNLQRLN